MNVTEMIELLKIEHTEVFLKSNQLDQIDAQIKHIEKSKKLKISNHLGFLCNTQEF